MLSATKKSVVGLDIEAGYVAAVEARPESVAVERAAVMELPPGVVREGEVVDRAALTQSLRDLFAEHKLGKRVRVGLANQRVVMRTIDLPPITDEKQLSSAVRFQAQDQIPMPLDQAVLEHQSLGLVGTADGPKTRVVLVAARRDMVEQLLGAVRDAGLRPEGLDLSAFALIRAMHRTGDPDTATAYLNVGAITNVALATGTQCIFTRVVPTGVDQVVTELSDRRGLTHEHAAGWLQHVGMVQPIDAIEGDPDIVQAARLVLEAGSARIADEVRTTLNFYAAQDTGMTAERAVVTGSAVSIPGFAEAVAAELLIPAEVRTVAAAAGAHLDGADCGPLAVAAGLTLEEAPA